MADDAIEVRDDFPFHPCDSPRGMMYYNLKVLTETQQQALNKLKLRTIRDNENYLAENPQIRACIAMIYRIILLNRPRTNLHLTIAEYFSKSRTDLDLDIEDYLSRRENIFCNEFEGKIHESYTDVGKVELTLEEIERAKSPPELGTEIGAPASASGLVQLELEKQISVTTFEEIQMILMEELAKKLDRSERDINFRFQEDLNLETQENTVINEENKEDGVDKVDQVGETDEAKNKEDKTGEIISDSADKQDVQDVTAVTEEVKEATDGEIDTPTVDKPTDGEKPIEDATEDVTAKPVEIQDVTVVTEEVQEGKDGEIEKPAGEEKPIEVTTEDITSKPVDKEDLQDVKVVSEEVQEGKDGEIDKPTDGEKPIVDGEKPTVDATGEDETKPPEDKPDPENVAVANEVTENNKDFEEKKDTSVVEELPKGESPVIEDIETTDEPVKEVAEEKVEILDTTEEPKSEEPKEPKSEEPKVLETEPQ